MATIGCAPAPVLHLLVGDGTKPALVQVCHYCVEPFTPTRDPGDGSLWDVDDHGRHCCNDCHCPKCLIGHYPDQDCPAAPDPAADQDVIDREEATVYGDPDARYDAPCLGDCD